MSTVNSFTDSVNQLVQQVNVAMESVVKVNESLTTQADTTNMSIEQTNPITGDVSTVIYALPSYNKVLETVNNMSQTLETFISGTGKIFLNDGKTYREVFTVPVAVSPSQISGIAAPAKFTTRSNWFFESMMFPQLIVSFDLKNKIDDRSDRAVVKRVIFNNFDSTETRWFLDNIVGATPRTYYETITFLNEQGKEYWEDEEVQDLPLSTEPYTGYFVITDKQTVSGKEWFYIDTTNYGITSDSPVVKDHQLTVGDLLRYNNSVWKIDNIQIDEKRIQVIPYIGMEYPSVNGIFEIYSTPFSTKSLNIPIGYDECDMIFIKGVNDDFNIIGDDWGKAISFYTNNLVLENDSITLEDYYNNYVSDFGKQLEGQAKEKFIPAFFGEIPDPPVIAVSNFEVKQINTHLNSALDTESIKNTQVQIDSTKTYINSLRSTVAKQKAQLVQLDNVGEREDLNNKITANINQLSLTSTEYTSLVKSLSTTAYQNNAVATTPKYRIRGFFPIPEPKGTPAQQIVQFECAYRYLKLDNTGNALNTYTYTDPSTGQIMKGVFTDWVMATGFAKIKKYNETTKTYEWVVENISDGDNNNINQIDIPIQKGEKVEVKIRSISEAGWPTNPLKSVWSNSVVMDFPANLETSDQLVNILNEASLELQSIQMDETLSAAGIPTHLADSIPNPNSGTGTYFKHQSANLAFDVKTKDYNGLLTKTSTTDLQSHLEKVTDNTYITLSRPSGSLNAYLTMTGTIQQFFQAIIEKDPSIYDDFVTLVIT